MTDSLEIGISLTLVSDTPAKIRGDGKFLKTDGIPALKVIAKSLGHKTFSFALCLNPWHHQEQLAFLQSMRSKPSIIIQSGQRACPRQIVWLLLLHLVNSLTAQG